MPATASLRTMPSLALAVCVAIAGATAVTKIPKPLPSIAVATPTPANQKPGGPTVVRVTGFASEGGKLLCDVELPAELPRADGTYTLDAPRQAAPKKEKEKRPDI